MKTESIMDGIWNAKTPAELSSHLDAWESAVSRGECSYSGEECALLEAAAIERQANNCKRMLRL